MIYGLLFTADLLFGDRIQIDPCLLALLRGHFQRKFKI